MTLIPQNHIHLSDTLGGSPENAPNIVWKSFFDGRKVIPEVVMELSTTMTGRLIPNVLLSGGQPLRKMNYRYTLRVDDFDGITKWDRYEILLGFQGKALYLVDNLHCADGVSHTPYVKTVFMRTIDDIEDINPLASVLKISIELVDYSL